MFVAQHAGDILMSLFGEGEIAEKLTRRGVRGAFCRLDIETIGLLLHRLGFLPHRIQRKVCPEPVRLALVKALHMLAPDQRDALAETLAMDLDQRFAMCILDLGHILEDLGRGRKFAAQPVGISEIDAGIVFLGGDPKGKDLLLGQRFERSFRGSEKPRQHDLLQFLELF